jgi:hypothetical protein
MDEAEFGQLQTAGIACTDLIADPASWINRRVETIEMLSREETRRRVSVDFTLSSAQLAALDIGEGIVVPISVLTKEARRNFDLRDESGRAVPVLGKEQNVQLAQLATLFAAFSALPNDLPHEAFEILAADLNRIVSAGDVEEGEDALGALVDRAERDRWSAIVLDDETCAALLSVLWSNYVLFAVLPRGGPNRRILKYSYSEEFTFERDRASLKERWSLLKERFRRPDLEKFLIECPGAGRAASLHVEVAVPEELRVYSAVLLDRDEDVGERGSDDREISLYDENVSRASLYASGEIGPMSDVVASLEVGPERAGWTVQAAATSFVIAVLLWLGALSRLGADNPGPAVSILLTGAALFSGVTAVQGQHILAKKVFAVPRRWLALATAAALAGSATLAMQVPCRRPVTEWRIAAIFATLAAARLIWHPYARLGRLIVPLGSYQSGDRICTVRHRPNSASAGPARTSSRALKAVLDSSTQSPARERSRPPKPTSASPAPYSRRREPHCRRRPPRGPPQSAHRCVVRGRATRRLASRASGRPESLTMTARRYAVEVAASSVLKRRDRRWGSVRAFVPCRTRPSSSRS